MPKLRMTAWAGQSQTFPICCQILPTYRHCQLDEYGPGKLILSSERQAFTRTDQLSRPPGACGYAQCSRRIAYFVRCVRFWANSSKGRLLGGLWDRLVV
jgi:hypothetical protein